MRTVCTYKYTTYVNNLAPIHRFFPHTNVLTGNTHGHMLRYSNYYSIPPVHMRLGYICLVDLKWWMFVVSSFKITLDCNIKNNCAVSSTTLTREKTHEKLSNSTLD